MSHRTGECSANEKSIAVYGEYLEMSLQALAMGRPPCQTAAPVVGQGVLEQWLTELDGGGI
jgi:hypothetical protein